MLRRLHHPTRTLMWFLAYRRNIVPSPAATCPTSRSSPLADLCWLPDLRPLLTCAATQPLPPWCQVTKVKLEQKQQEGIAEEDEGEETGEWVLVDLADIVVHIMQPSIRAYYNLEEVWGGKPVRMKLLPESTRPVSANDLSVPAGMPIQDVPGSRRAASRNHR